MQDARCVGAVLRQSSGEALLVLSPRSPRRDLLKPCWAILRSASHDMQVAGPFCVYVPTTLGASPSRRRVALRARSFMFGSRGRRSFGLDSPSAPLCPSPGHRAVSASPAAHRPSHPVPNPRLSRSCVGVIFGLGVISASLGGHRRWSEARLKQSRGHGVTRPLRALANTSP